MRVQPDQTLGAFSSADAEIPGKYQIHVRKKNESPSPLAEDEEYCIMYFDLTVT